MKSMKYFNVKSTSCKFLKNLFFPPQISAHAPKHVSNKTNFCASIRTYTVEAIADSFLKTNNMKQTFVEFKFN